MENIINDNKSPKQILVEAAALLENEIYGWGQNSFFEKLNENSSLPACVMCAHGALKYCGSKAVREKVDAFDLTSAGIITEAVASAAHAFERAAGKAAQEGKTVLEYIQSRPKHYGTNYNLAYAHYLAAKAGLTFAFNDAPGRTKQEVIAKLREAALLAE